jgi:hypothetical protein
MSDARIILLATNSSNDPLNAKPQNTFFKVGYNNTTNFGLDMIPLDLNMREIPNFFQFDKVYYIDIPKDGDILTNLFLEFTINDTNWYTTPTSGSSTGVFNTALGFLDNIEFLCNDRVITRLDSSYIYAWNDYNLNSCQKKYFDQMTSWFINKDNYFTDMNGQSVLRLYLPIPFWFCRNPDLGIPLWACQSDRFGIRFKIKEDFWTGIGVENPQIVNIRPFIQVAQLDEEERKKFNEDGLEYIIEQVDWEYKEIEENKVIQKVQLQTYPFVKEIVWLVQNTNLDKSNKDLFDFRNHNSIEMGYQLSYSNIIINGNNVAPIMNSKFFSLIQRWETHMADKSVFNMIEYSPDLDNRFYANEIYNYSFALTPEKVEPSGFLSTDKFNNITLELNINPNLEVGSNRMLRIYQVRLNMFRVKNGHFSILHY